MDENKQKLLTILQTVCPRVDFENETALVDNDLIDSLDMVTIVSEIAGNFPVDLGVEDLTPDNFNSIDAMLVLIKSKAR